MAACEGEAEADPVALALVRADLLTEGLGVPVGEGAGEPEREGELEALAVLVAVVEGERDGAPCVGVMSGVAVGEREGREVAL